MKRFFVAACFLFLIGWHSSGWALSEKGFEMLNIFTKVLHYVENDYVENVDEEKLLRGAIRGMLSALDPHTVYLSPSVYKHLKADTSGVFGGIGLEITVRDGWVTVVSPLEGTPAFRAGIKPGDRILMINGVSTKGMDLGTAVKEMRGKRGSSVHLTLGRKGLKKPISVTVVRREIRAPSVRAELVDKKYLVVKIASFQERTTQDLKNILKKYEKDILSRGLILDMRNNPGGLLEQAVQVSDLFLDSGVIVTTESKKGEIDRREATPFGISDIRYPMIALVNGGSASAAEIVAGALKDHERAIIMGVQTFGKGSVQSVIELEDGSALKMTIAKYLTPKGRSIQADGIHPDIIVEPTPPPKQPQEAGIHLREEHLSGHLEGSKEILGKRAEEVDGEELDYQQMVAVNYLKSWDVFKEQKGKVVDRRVWKESKEKKEKIKKKKKEKKKREKKKKDKTS